MQGEYGDATIIKALLTIIATIIKALIALMPFIIWLERREY